MKIIALSDTHNQHHTLGSLPHGDVLVHCGDFTNTGTPKEIESFMDWFYQQPHRHKLVVWGNHEIPYFMYHKPKKYPNILCNTSITIDNIKFWGHPALPPDYNYQDTGVPWVFDSFQDSNDVMSSIPSDTDVVLTHSPPYGILDRTRTGFMIGNEELMVHISDRVRPKICIFGHVHNPGFHINEYGTYFYNTAMCDDGPYLVYPPTVIHI